MAMLTGMLALLAFSILPPAWTVVLAGMMLTILLSIRRETRVLLFGVFGFVWFWWCVQHQLIERLAPQLEGKTVTVSGWVTSIPQPEAEYVRFRFRVERLDSRAPGAGTPEEIRLTWSGAHPDLAPGQHWRFAVRLKRPRGFMNPGGFDYEGWLFRQGIGATGYVRHEQAGRLGGPLHNPLLRLRAAVSRSIRNAIGDSQFGGIAAALAVGDTTAITPQQWQVFRSTGTAHLVAISGLHIGLLAGLMLLFTGLIWRRNAWLCERVPVPIASWIAALAGATAYAAMAGFSVPTQRALVMLAVAAGCVVLRRRERWQDVLGLSLIVVLLLDPLSICSIGFWLSFGAVASILYAVSGWSGRKSGWWRELLRTQWAVGIGLLPLLIFFFHRAALIAPLANLFAVPLYSFLVVPLVLSGTLLLPCWHWGGAALLKSAAGVMAISWPVLERLANLPHGQLAATAPGLLTLAAAGVGVIWLLAPRGLPARWMGAVLLLPLVVSVRQGISPGDFDLTLLDVGQGLSAVVRTAHHTLIYDTGPAFSPDSDTVKLVLLPWLQSQGIARPDMTVISHEDNDHAGGLPRLRRHFPGMPVLSGAVGKFANVWLCVAGQHWRWDGVRFEVLYPNSAAPSHGNNAACVLKISGAGGRALLVGDLMKAGEERLIALHPHELSAEVLVAPHHGSNSSSSRSFVDAVAPKYVLFPVGYRNRWHFPKPAVIARYRASGALLADTVHDGAIELSFRQGRAPVITGRWRKDAARFWTMR
ncbi:MAG TPA: DNA internalization-related competence protein ComEC/Rec2 [Gammaproteobacteria bacterium]|nr:DNA internalization-related competence protein ComEC/Rec2 [Gammaproteobacteria bacterium]